MTDSLYTKCPLPPHPGHIRLLQLHPSSDPSAPLSGIIFATTFDASRSSYEALSYCWGDDARSETITLHVRNEEAHPGDSHTDDNTTPIQLPITRSLAEAIADIRFQSSDRLLWADALCIDQAHNGEKSVQVRQMYDVYANSRRTLVYLGRGGSEGMQAAIAHRDYLRAVNFGSKTSADSLPATNAGTLVTWDPAVGVVHTGKGSPASAGDESDCLDYRTAAILPDPKADVIFAHGPDIVDSWMCILERPWTTRAWTTQEFVAGPDVLMQLGQGEVTLTLDDLSNLARYLRYDLIWGGSERDSGPKFGGPSGVYLPLVTMKTAACKVFWMIRLRLSLREEDGAMSIGGVLGSIRGDSIEPVLKTRDARDVLWSLLALSRNRSVAELQPNYDLSVDEVYRRFSIYIATAEAFSFSVLLSLPLQTQTGTPSWRLVEGLEVSKGDRSYYRQKPSCAKGYWGTANEQGTELTILGTLVDRIARLVEPAEIDVRLTADKACVRLWCVTTSYNKVQEATSWPGLFVLPDESPDQAAFKFFRGRASWMGPGIRDIRWDRHQRVFNASWEQYAHLHCMATLACLSHSLLASEGPAVGDTPADFIYSAFFELVRDRGWPMDMVRHYLISDAIEPSGFPDPEELFTETACLTALRMFADTASAHLMHFVPYWQGKTVGITSRGHLCNVDKEARVGDWVAVTATDRSAVILRECPGGAYSLVGRAYAHGLLEGMEMHGDVEEELRLC